MNRLSGKERKYLKKLAHHLNPVVLIGKNGVTDEVIVKTDEAILSHELIKIRYIGHKSEKKQLSMDIATQTGSELVGMIGHIAILYRQHPEKEKQKIQIPDF